MYIAHRHGRGEMTPCELSLSLPFIMFFALPPAPSPFFFLFCAEMKVGTEIIRRIVLLACCPQVTGKQMWNVFPAEEKAKSWKRWTKEEQKKRATLWGHVCVRCSSGHISNFYAWLLANLWTPRAHSLSEGRPSSNRVQLIQTGICFPFVQKDSLGQIGKQQLSFGADQHNSEAITWNRSLSAPEIIFRLNLELGSEIGRWSFSQSDVFALSCPDKTLLTCGRDVFNQWVHFVFVLLWPIYSREGQAQHFCTT